MTAILAVSGIKNSGKTTLIENLVRDLSARGVKTAVIKHDGHDFRADVPGTDSWRHKQAGAYGTAVFSAGKFLVVKDCQDVQVQEMISFFPEADLIFLEGFKYSVYPKIEVIRKGISDHPVCDPVFTCAYVTDWTEDFPWKNTGIPVYSFSQTKRLSDAIYEKII